MSEDIYIWDEPVTVAASRRSHTIQVHETLERSNRMVLEVNARQAEGVARVLRAIDQWPLARTLEAAIDFLNGNEPREAAR